jgi:dihydroneopterin aldolase
MNDDIVFIEDLRIQTIIGVFDWEREITQTVSLDLEMSFDIARAAASDDIADTLDYKAVAKRLIQFVEGSEFQLVEALADHCARIVLEEFPVCRVWLKLSKPGAVRGSSAVGVSVVRQRPAA